MLAKAQCGIAPVPTWFQKASRDVIQLGGCTAECSTVVKEARVGAKGEEAAVPQVSSLNTEGIHSTVLLGLVLYCGKVS